MRDGQSFAKGLAEGRSREGTFSLSVPPAMASPYRLSWNPFSSLSKLYLKTMGEYYQLTTTHHSPNALHSPSKVYSRTLLYPSLLGSFLMFIRSISSAKSSTTALTTTICCEPTSMGGTSHADCPPSRPTCSPCLAFHRQTFR